MGAGVADPGFGQKISGWTRFLGVSLRPWSGQSPLSLILRGGIQVAICLFFLIWVPGRIASEGGLQATVEELGFLQRWIVLAAVGLVVVLLLGAAKIVVGALDLVPRRTVTGQVLSLRDRRFGDFLPRFVQLLLDRRNTDHGRELRRLRTEVVLQTPEGVRQWTVRSARTRRELTPGRSVRMTVTPLVGHVAKVEPLPG